MPPRSTYGYRTQAEIDAEKEAEERQQEEAVRQRVSDEILDYSINYAQDWWNNSGSFAQNAPAGSLDLGTTGNVPQSLDFGAASQGNRFNLGQQATAAEQSFSLGNAAQSFDLGPSALDFSSRGIGASTTGASSAAAGAGAASGIGAAAESFNLGAGGLSSLNFGGSAATGAAGAAGAAEGIGAGSAGSYTLNSSLDFSAAGQAAATQGAAQGTASQSTGMTMGQAAGWIGAAASAYYLGNIMQNRRRDPVGGAMAGAQMGGQVAGIYGAAVGAVMGFMIGLAGDDKVTAQTKAMMQGLKETPLGEDLTVQTVNGPISLGKYYGKINPDTWEFKDPVSHLAVSWTGPLAYMMTGNKQMGWRLNMLFANGLYVQGDPDKTRSNVLSLYKQMGVKPAQVQAALNEMVDKGIISKEQFDSMSNVLGTLKPGGWNEQVRDQMMAIPFPGTQGGGQAQAPAQAPGQAPAQGPAPQQQGPYASVPPSTGPAAPPRTDIPRPDQLVRYNQPPPTPTRPRNLKQASVMIQQRQQAQPPQQRPMPRPQTQPQQRPQQRQQPQRRAA